MEITNSIPNFKMIINKSFLNEADKIKDLLIEKQALPKCRVRAFKGSSDWQAEYAGTVEDAEMTALGKGDRVCYDFEEHCVGYISFDISFAGSPPDAPALLRLKLGEKIFEIGEESASYDGRLSSGWIQEEFIHVDELPSHVELPRRYAFRYFEILVKDTSPSYKIKIKNVKCKTVSSADLSKVEKIDIPDRELADIDRISINTMKECMQEVFEDGPKRDRRLWVGDLRLQALVNYETFKNYDLVKKCLYLFAGLRQNSGSIAACIYAKSEYKASDIYLFDYSLLYISCLYDYYEATCDVCILKELYPVAKRQAEIALELFDENGLVRDSDKWWCFIDWNDRLNKQACAQAVFIYAVKQLCRLATALEKGEDVQAFNLLINRAEDAALKYLWDEEKGFFVSGSERQISASAQAWFVMAGVFDREKNKNILKNIIKTKSDIEMVTPYANHHFVQALVDCSMMHEAVEYIKYYWGGMVNDGADCFYEIYNPKQKYISPYGSRIIDSYCHA